MFFAPLPICLEARRGGDVRPAALLPMAAQTGDQSLQGWAGLGWASQEVGGEKKEGGPCGGLAPL